MSSIRSLINYAGCVDLQCLDDCPYNAFTMISAVSESLGWSMLKSYIGKAASLRGVNGPNPTGVESARSMEEFFHRPSYCLSGRWMYSHCCIKCLHLKH